MNEVKQSWVSRLTPTLIVEFLFFRLLIGCIDNDEDGSKTFLTLHLDQTQETPALGFSLFWLANSRPLIGLHLMPFPVGYILWIPSHEVEEEDDGPDLPSLNGQV